MANNSNNSSAAPGDNLRFEELGRGCYAYSADGCSNTGVVIGERGVLVIDGQANPALAEPVLQKIREKSDKPVRLLVFSHYHADNTLGASAFEPGEIIASDLTRRMMDTRGKDEIRLARERFPAVFAQLPAMVSVESPTMTIASSMTVDLGGLEVRLMHLGRGHTMGDLVVWVPSSGVIFAGDLVQTSAAPYCGDAHLSDWPRALDRITAFRPNALMPGRGRAALGSHAVASAIENTRDFVTTLRDAAVACVDQGLGLKDTCDAVADALSPQFGERADFEAHLPFNVARAYDEALGLDQPQVWTLERSADLRDAVFGGSEVQTADVQEDEILETATEEPLTTDESGADTSSEGAEAELVSDSEFAASLELDAEDGKASEADALDLSEEDIVSGQDEATEDTADADTAEGDDPKKVLEDAR